jgi:hypothetical protein
MESPRTRGRGDSCPGRPRWVHVLLRHRHTPVSARASCRSTAACFTGSKFPRSPGPERCAQAGKKNRQLRRVDDARPARPGACRHTDRTSLNHGARVLQPCSEHRSSDKSCVRSPAWPGPPPQLPDLGNGIPVGLCSVNGERRAQPTSRQGSRLNNLGSRLSRRLLRSVGCGEPVPYLLLADKHTYRCRNWDQLVERLVWAHRTSCTTAKAWRTTIDSAPPSGLKPPRWWRQRPRSRSPIRSSLRGPFARSVRSGCSRGAPGLRAPGASTSGG